MSNIFEKLVSTKDKVKMLLRDYPHLRDSDNKLIANFWYQEIKKNNQTSLIAFLDDFANSKYTSPESIRRCRQKIQEQHPELKGRNHRFKKKEGESLRKEIKDL